MNDAPRDYYDIYLKRLNRYGLDYKTRTQNKRERDFENYLIKSVYRVDFEYNLDTIPAIFERYKQDETESLHYLLTRTSDNIPNGTIVMIPNKDDTPRPWMIFYLEEIQASGYNRYVTLRMTHFLKWSDKLGTPRESWAYMHGKGDSVIRDQAQSTKKAVSYTEDFNYNFFIMPANNFIKKDDYLEVGEEGLKQAYRVTGYDFQSSPGIEYVTVEPIYFYDKSTKPVKTAADDPDDFFWLDGGI